MIVKELKAEAKKYYIRGYSRMTKEELIKQIANRKKQICEGEEPKATETKIVINWGSVPIRRGLKGVTPPKKTKSKSQPLQPIQQAKQQLLNQLERIQKFNPEQHKQNLLNQLDRIQNYKK